MFCIGERKKNIVRLTVHFPWPIASIYARVSRDKWVLHDKLEIYWSVPGLIRNAIIRFISA